MVGVLATYFLTFYDVDLNLADEGLQLAHALSLEKKSITEESFGRLLHRAPSMVHVALYHLTGAHDVRSSRLLWVGLRILLALMLYAVARRLLPRGLAVALASLVVIAAGPWHKSWYPFALGLMLFLACTISPGRRRLRLLTIGAVGGALASLYSAGIMVGVILPLYAWLIYEPIYSRPVGSQIRHDLRSSLGVTLTLGLGSLVGLFILYLVCGTLLILIRDASPLLLLDIPEITLRFLAPESIGRLFRFARGWTEAAYLPVATLFLHQDPALERWMIGWIPGVTFLLSPLAILITCALAHSAQKRGDQERARLLVILVVLSAANLIKAATRMDLFHITQGGGPVYLLMFFLLYRGGVRLRLRWSDLAGRIRLALAAGLILLTGIFPLGYGAAVLLSSGQWAASISSLTPPLRRLTLERATLRLPPGRAAHLERLVGQIQRWTGPDDPIFVMPFCPTLYFLAERTCAVDDQVFPYGLLAVLPALGLVPGVTDPHLARQLEIQRVKVVVTCPNIDPRLEYKSRLPRTRALLARDYRQISSNQGFHLFVRRDLPLPRSAPRVEAL